MVQKSMILKFSTVIMNNSRLFLRNTEEKLPRGIYFYAPDNSAKLLLVKII